MKLSELMFILEGGNTTTINKKTGESKSAEKIDFNRLSIESFRAEFIDLFTSLNRLFLNKYKEKLWANDSLIKKGLVFNGSTSYIMNPKMDPKEIFKYKQSSGDIDIVIPAGHQEKLWDLLDSLEGKTIGNFEYHGCFSQNREKLGDQLLTIFVYKPENIACQIDFENADFKDGKPTEFARFSHGSSFEDAKESIKAFAHKLLLRALVGAISANPNIVVATKSSKPDNIKLKADKSTPRMAQFSVTRGLRFGLVPMLDKGEPVYYEGKQVYQEQDTSDSEFITDLKEIFKYMFKSSVGLKDLHSFIGVVKLMKKHCDEKTIKLTQERFFDIIFGMPAQFIEPNDLKLDRQVKLTAYNYFLKELRLRHPGLEADIDRYYIVKGSKSKAKA